MKYLLLLAAFIALVSAQTETGETCPLYNNALFGQMFWEVSTEMNTGDDAHQMYYCDFYEDNTCCSKYFVQTTFEDYLLEASQTCKNKVRLGACALCSPSQENFVKYVTGVDNIVPGLEYYELNLCTAWCEELYDDCQDAIYLDTNTEAQVTVLQAFDSGDDFCMTLYDQRQYDLRVNVQQQACWSDASSLLAVLAFALL